MSGARIVVCVAAGLPLLPMAPSSVHAQWTEDGVAVCTAPGNQTYPAIVSDGAGGVIVAWADFRGVDIYAQRLDAAGIPLWAADGVAVCTVAGPQEFPMIVPDGAGGAIIAWRDRRYGSPGVYAQRLSASGAPQWTTGGVRLSNTTPGFRSAVVSDGAGGAIVGWTLASAQGPYALVAQRVGADGSVRWTPPVDVVGLGTVVWDSVAALPDGEGGAFFVWRDGRGDDTDLYTQRVDSTGALLWTAGGVPVAVALGEQVEQVMVHDGAGGFVVVWRDLRTGVDWDLYAQRIESASGSPLWAPNGVAVCDGAGDQTSPAVTGDGLGGAIVAWADTRPTSGGRAYVQHLDASGTPLWVVGGEPLTTVNGGGVAECVVVASGANGAIVAWADSSGGSPDIRAQHVTGTGARLWGSVGLAVCDAAGSQLQPVVASEDSMGAVVAWQDLRGSSPDIYAQRLRGLAPPAPRPSTLVGYWKLNGDGSDPDTCAALTPAAGASFIPGVLNEAAGIAGDSSAYLIGAASQLFDLTPAGFTAECWLRSRTLDFGANPRVVRADNGVEVESWEIAICKLDPRCTPGAVWTSGVHEGTVLYFLPSRRLAGDGSWHHVAFTYDGSEIVLYLDGTRDTSFSRPDMQILVGGGLLKVGLLDEVWRRDQFDGEIDEIRIWRGARSAAEIAADASHEFAGSCTGLTDVPRGPRPIGASLGRPHPNPFTRACRIEYLLPRSMQVTIDVFDIAGARVRRLVAQRREAGPHFIDWDGCDDAGRRRAPGLYWIRLRTAAGVQSRTVLLLR